MDRINPIRVFVTDDHPIVTAGLETVFRHERNQKLVGMANSSEEMMKFLPKARPQVLLLDLNLPGTDYYENIQRIKSNFPWIKILVYTSYTGPDLIKSLLKEGISGYLFKGAPPKEIRKAVEAVVNGETYIYTAPVATKKQEVNKHSNSLQSPKKDDFRKRLSLSRREQEILALISRGLTSQLIGETLFISRHTVETHRKNILRKLDFNSSAELVKFAVQQGLV